MMKLLLSLGTLAVASLVNGSPASATPPRAALPVVNLNYELHQAISLNSSGPLSYYNFTNIRFGAPPTGRQRFHPAKAPKKKHNPPLTNGSGGIIKCPQANPGWEQQAFSFLPLYLSGKNYSAYTQPSAQFNTTNASTTYSTMPMPSKGETEDCLFLDVFAPTKIFDAAQEKSHGKTKSQGAPVLVWIYGGGYTSGSKTDSGNPATLITNSTSDGMIFVQLNYRLGIFGWLSGNHDITANVGLQDQRLALEWIHEHIHKFGGDPSRITVMGESAGGGSIMHHIASPNKYPALFKQAIPQSPAYEPFLASQTKPIFEGILATSSLLLGKNITRASDLRSLPFETLYALNVAIISTSSYGTFTFGPVVDGSYVPDLPLRRISQGNYQKSVTVFVGHNSDEGLLFSPPFVQNNTQTQAAIIELFPSMNSSEVDYIMNTLYPAVYDGTQPYTNSIGRTAQLVSDFLVGCNAHVLASTNGSRGYLYNIVPGLHGSDIEYTFFNGDTSTPDEGAFPVQASVATTFQHAIGAFVTGGGDALGAKGYALYGGSKSANGSVVNGGLSGNKEIVVGGSYSSTTVTQLNLTSFGVQMPDPGARELQCKFWVEAPYDIGGKGRTTVEAST